MIELQSFTQIVVLLRVSLISPKTSTVSVKRCDHVDSFISCLPGTFIITFEDRFLRLKNPRSYDNLLHRWTTTVLNFTEYIQNLPFLFFLLSWASLCFKQKSGVNLMSLLSMLISNCLVPSSMKMEHIFTGLTMKSLSLMLSKFRQAVPFVSCQQPNMYDTNLYVKDR